MILAVLLLVLIAVRIGDPQVLRTLRFEAFDLLQRLEPRELSSGAVAVVDIDEASLAALGQWPWARNTVAEMVQTLLAAGAVTVGFDVLFAEPDRLSPDLFAQNHPDLPAAIRAFLSSLPSNELHLAEVLLGSPVVLGMSASHDMSRPSHRRAGKQTPVALLNGDPRPYLFRFPMALRNISQLEDSATGQGIFTLTPEVDGIVRRVPAVLSVADQILPSLSIEMLRVATGAAHYSVTLNPQGAGVEAVTVGGHRIPTDSNGRIWHRFSKHDPSIYVSAADLLAGSFDPARIKGRMVLIGTSAVGLRDLRATPLEDSMPGVEVHAQILDSMLENDLLVRPVYALGMELGLALFAGGLLAIIIPRLSARSGAIALTAVVTALAVGCYGSFGIYRHVFDPTFPGLVAVVAFGYSTLGNYARSDRQKRQIRSAFSQYLSPALVQQLADRPELLRLGGESRELTFLFTDIAGFTRFTEQSEPSLLVELLNRYLDQACQIVMTHGGTVDKIVGDAVHAMFGAPLDQPDHAQRAVRCALAIDSYARAFHSDQKRKGHDFGATRIGVNTGQAVVGNFGGESRFDYTAHGDAINTAARMEQANKELGTTICVARSTADLCEGLAFRPVGRLRLRGKEQAVQVFEPLADDDLELGPTKDYGKAYELLARGQDAARPAFARLAGLYPDDPLITLHHRRLEAGTLSDELVFSGA